MKLYKIIIVSAFILSVLLCPNDDLFSAENSDRFLIAGSFGVCNPMADMGDECESGKATGISLKYVTRGSKGAYGLSYVRSKHDGKGDQENIEYTISRVLFTSNPPFYASSLLFISGTLQMGLAISEAKTEDDSDSVVAFMWGLGAAIELYIQEWLSIGPRIDFSSGTYTTSRQRYLSYDPPISTTIFETRKARFLDLSAVVTIHL